MLFSISLGFRAHSCHLFRNTTMFSFQSVKNNSSEKVFKLSEKTDDLFAAPADFSLAHCVSVDLRMGKGIAVKFRDKFRQIPKLKQQNPKVGGVLLLKDKSRYIYYLITKQQVYHKPTYQTMENSLIAMRKHMVQNGVKKLAIPRIGCGLDGLIWPQVKKKIEEVFGNDDIEIVVYNYTPK